MGSRRANTIVEEPALQSVEFRIFAGGVRWTRCLSLLQSKVRLMKVRLIRPGFVPRLQGGED